jgi:hypothetical protein
LFFWEYASHKQLAGLVAEPQHDAVIFALLCTLPPVYFQGAASKMFQRRILFVTSRFAGFGMLVEWLS